MSGVAPNRGIDFVLLAEILGPARHGGFCIQASQVAHGAERVNTSLVNERGRSRTTRIGDFVRTIIFVLPNHPAVVGIQTQDSLVAGNALAGRPQRLAGFVPGTLAIHYVNSAISDRGTAVALVDRHSPEDLRPARRKLFQNTRLPPDTVAVDSQPLWPISPSTIRDPSSLQ